MDKSGQGESVQRFPLFRLRRAIRPCQVALIVCSWLLLAACSTTPPGPVSAGIILLDECTDLAAEFRQSVSDESRTNAGVPANPALPFLHGTRHADLLITEIQSDRQAQELLSYMARLGVDVRRAENTTLAAPWSENRLAALDRCSFRLALDVEQTRSRELMIERLQAQPTMAKNYSSLPRWLGAYALLRPIFSWRIDLLHAEERAAFAARQAFLEPRSYQLAPSATLSPLSSLEVATQFSAGYQRSSLALPQIEQQTLQRLTQQHAPELVIETLGQQDLLGTPALEESAVTIDTEITTAYFIPSVTRFAGRNLLQLNYVFWFPAREPRRWLDLYAGELDSLIWRVTLDENGDVLLYDSIHSCGCYQKFYLASQRIRPRSAPLSDEPANIFTLGERSDSGQGMRVYLSDNEHYVLGVEARSSRTAAAADVTYRLAPYQALYSLADANGFSSMFGPDGIVPGSERLERFTLWPTGITNVGAMRQWGTHATGFVNRQHFDDATLLDYYFQLVD